MDQETSCGTGPILTTPGGWGLRNPEPKGPGQRTTYFSQFSAAVGGRKFGGIMTLLTIALRHVFRPWPRVTAHPVHQLIPAHPRSTAEHAGSRPLQPCPVGAIMAGMMLAGSAVRRTQEPALEKQDDALR